MPIRVTTRPLFAFLLLLPVLPAAAQTTGGVFGSDVREGHRSVQYRATYDPDDGRLAQRMHYQHSLNDDFMVRGLVHFREEADDRSHYDFFQAELFWDLYQGTGYRTGFRFDARIRSQGRPGMVGVNWINTWSVGENYSARLILLTGIDIGNGAREGIALGTRAHFLRRLRSGASAGLEMFSSYGTTERFASLSDQSHQLGPVVSGPVGDRWSFLGSLLFGITNGAADRNIRLWIGRSF